MLGSGHKSGVHMTRLLDPGSTQHEKISEKVGTFFIIDNFVGLFLNLYGRSMVAI